MHSPLANLLRFHEQHEPGAFPEALESEEYQRLQTILHPRVLHRYRQALGKFGASALVEMERSVCAGCNMRQPAIPAKLADQLYSCQNCGRILYNPDDAFDLLVS